MSGHTRDVYAVVFSPESKAVASAGEGGLIRLWDTATGQPFRTLVGLGDAQGLVATASGHFRGSPRVERELVYVVETDAGEQTLTPEEFEKKYGWKNDPEQVRLGQ